MQDFGEDLVNVLDNLRIKMVIGLGEGVGSNILARFAALHASRCLGVVLISPTVSAATAMNKFKVRCMYVHSSPVLCMQYERLSFEEQ
jgi:pimeloyl-ACP methyl ester carboxylesterase